MVLNELLSQLDQLGYDEKMQVLDHLIEGLEHKTDAELSDNETTSDQDDAAWDASFARSQDVLTRMAARARQNRDQGLNQELDPNKL